MIDTFRASCSSCKASFAVRYGREKKTIAYEVYSCPKCKILFSLSNSEDFLCPMCKNNELTRYNFHKEENIRYYQKMFDQNLLTKEKYEMLVEYWKKMENKKCPMCGKDAMEWKIQESS